LYVNYIRVLFREATEVPPGISVEGKVVGIFDN
jgi:hypothetical protein